MNYPNLLSQNVYANDFKDKFLIVGSCFPDMYPEIAKKFEKNWKNIVVICLEQFHYNQFVAKLFDILALGNTKKVGFLTVDGSPHCVQVHYASKYLKRGLSRKVSFEHYVANKEGKIFRLSIKGIDKSRDLSLGGIKIDIK